MRRSETNLLLVLSLLLATVWCGEVTAAHVHLDSDEISCEICHNLNLGKISLEQPVVTTTHTPFSSIIKPSTVAPRFQLAAPQNSRAPPRL